MAQHGQHDRVAAGCEHPGDTADDLGLLGKRDHLEHADRRHECEVLAGRQLLQRQRAPLDLREALAVGGDDALLQVDADGGIAALRDTPRPASGAAADVQRALAACRDALEEPVEDSRLERRVARVQPRRLPRAEVATDPVGVALPVDVGEALLVLAPVRQRLGRCHPLDIVAASHRARAYPATCARTSRGRASTSRSAEMPS